MGVGYSGSVDWGGPNVHDDVTDRLHGESGMSIRYGRDQARALSPMAPGTANFTLMNDDLVLLPENTGSPLYGYVNSGRDVVLTADLPEAGLSGVGLFSGSTDDLEVLPDLDERKVRISCTDGLGRLRGVTVSTDAWQGLTSGQALHRLLDAVGWPPDKRDIDPGASTFPWWWVSDGDAYDEAMKILDSEGPTALIAVDTDNRVVFRDRHHRVTRAQSVTSQANWSGSVEPALSPPIGYDHGWRAIVNDVTFSVPLYSSTGAVEVVWRTEDTISIAAGESLAITASAVEPFFSAVTPVSGVDFASVSGSVAVALSRTSGTSVTIFLTAQAGSPVSIAGLQLRAAALSTGVTVQVKADNGASITKYGRRSWPDSRAPVWASLPDVQGIAQMILGQRGERLPTVTVTFKGGGTKRLVQQLTRDLSDRVHIDDGVSFTDADFFIEQIEHRTDGIDHQTTFGCEGAPSQIPDVFILGSATNGVLGTNRLGRRGLPDPATTFILGSATNGVLGTNILAP